MDEFNNLNNENEQNESLEESEKRNEQEIPQDYDPYNMPLEQEERPVKSIEYDTSYSSQNHIPPDFDPYKQPVPQNIQYGGLYLDANGMPYKTGLATASLVIGIVSLVLTFSFMIFIPPLGILPIIGIILGCVYKGKKQPVGKGTSTAGIICSAASLVLSVGFIAICVYAVMNYMPEIMEYLKAIDPDIYEQYYEMFYEMYPEWFGGIFFK